MHAARRDDAAAAGGLVVGIGERAIVSTLGRSHGLHLLALEDRRSAPHALDMARELSGKPAGSYGAQAHDVLEQAKVRSLRRNQSAAGGEIPSDQVTWELVVRDGAAWRPAGAAEVPGGVLDDTVDLVAEADRPHFGLATADR